MLFHFASRQNTDSQTLIVALKRRNSLSDLRRFIPANF